MLSDYELKQEVVNCISYKSEGGYWDFKREWYDDSQKSDMLLDIICMANNLENRDAFIIVGVDEENNYEIVDVSEDVNRRNTQNITDFLHSKSFAGAFIPTVFVRSIIIENKTVDVLIIKNTTNTPYFLSERYRDILDGNIYVRLQDSNTPRDMSAEWPYVEKLWAKHFGLSLSSIDKAKLYLGNPDDWASWPFGEEDDKQYYKYSPEFTIEWFHDNEFKTFYHYKDFSDDNIYAVVLRCHDTRLAVFPAIKYGASEIFVVLPEYYAVKDQNDVVKESYCFVKNSLRYAVFQYIIQRERYTTENEEISSFLSDVLMFDTDGERDTFLEDYKIIKGIT